jgi:hypothetical protein
MWLISQVLSEFEVIIAKGGKTGSDFCYICACRGFALPAFLPTGQKEIAPLFIADWAHYIFPLKRSSLI